MGRGIFRRIGIVGLGLCVLLFAVPGAMATDVPPPTTAPQPCIDVTKWCEDAGALGEAILYGGSVTNCGDVPLWTQVLDVLTGEVVVSESVEVGGSVFFSGSYSPDDCGPSTNTVKAKGTYRFEYVPGEFLTYNVYDIAEATCEVPCDSDKGCTLTPGYWKTHSIYGPAPYDATWAMIGENTLFFLSGASYYEVLWTEPSGGNAYYILAHAFIAADLNILSGASMPGDVMDAYNGAMEVFGLYTPDEIGALRGKDDLRKRFVRMAETLDEYNNGDLGPGHCND